MAVVLTLVQTKQIRIYIYTHYIAVIFLRSVLGSVYISYLKHKTALYWRSATNKLQV
jgi:hypothetical protein